jgi:hypothetical protein
MENKSLNKKRIKYLGEYLEQGIVETGNDENISVDSTLILKIKQGKMPDAVFVLQNFCKNIANRIDYTQSTFRVLFYLISLSEYENFISIDVKTIAENMNMSPLSVKRATKQLSDDNVIKKIDHPSDKRRIDYFLNPMAMWRGKTLNRDKFLIKAKAKKIQLGLFGE